MNHLHLKNTSQFQRLTGLASLASFFFLALPSPSHAVEVTFEQDSRLPIVYINAAVKTGSVSDPKGQSGLTNFMGEMLLRGTQKQTKKQIDLALDQIGGRLEVETRLESMIFRGAVISTQLQPFLSLVTEMLTEPAFPESEIKKLKSEVISVLQEERGNDAILASKFFNQFLFRGHPYGNSALGKMSDVQNFDKAQINSHYNRLIRDPLLLVVGTGDASPEILLNWGENLAKTRTTTLAATGVKESIPTPSTPPLDSERRRLLIVDKPDRTQTQINIGQIGIKMTDPEYFPLYLGNYAFGGHSFSAILMTEIRVKRGWSYGANSNFRHGLQPRSWAIHLFPAAKDAPAALKYTMGLVTDLKEKGLSSEKFQFAQTSLINSSGFMYNTPRKRVENTLIEKTLNLPEGFMRSYASELKKLRHKDVNTALKSFIQPDKLSIVVLGTAKDLKEPLTKAGELPMDEVKVVPYTQE